MADAGEIRIHSFRRCPFAIRVRMTLEEKALPYTVVEEDLSNLSEELVRLHPEARVPLLIHRGRAIYESSIITEYLDETFPNPPLMPQSPEARAEVRLWTYWCNQIFKVDLDASKYGWLDRTAEERAAIHKRMHEHLAKMESALEKSSFIVGSALSLADIHLFPFYRQLTRVKPEFPELNRYPELNHWLERITSRPSFERVMKKS